MDKVRRDKQKEIHARLDFREGSKERRTREDSHHSSARARTTRPKRLKVRDRLRYVDRHVLDRLGHRRQSAFDRLSKTYSSSTTKSRPDRTNSRDHPRSRSHPRRLDASNKDCPEDKECFCGIGKSYDDFYSHSYHDRDRFCHMKMRKDNESPLSGVLKSDSSDERYWKSKSKRHKPTDEDDLTRPWMCEEEDPFTPRIRNFKSSCRTRMPNNVKTYDRTGVSEDHVKIFQAAAQVERRAMPTWCHMFNLTLIGVARVWFDELPLESVDSYKYLKASFVAYFMQQKKYVKDLVEIHNIKQKDGETIEDFMEWFKLETGRMKGPPECMRIFEFTHEVNNLKLRKRLNEHVPKTMEETMITTTAFIQREVVATRKKKGHSTDECMQLKKQIEELVRTGKLSKQIKEIKHGRDQSKARKKETPAKDKPAAIYMIQSGVEGPLVIEAEIGGHMIHCMYVDGGSSMEILYEHCFNRLRPEVKNQMVLATTSLTGFSGETIWPLGQLRLLEGYSLVRQKKRGQAPKRAKAIQAKVQKLVEAAIMREVYDHDWLSNPVMVKKHDGSWRMCVDFTDLNKACPQDCYPLPKINYPFKCFWDAYKGYHQIQLADSDEEKMAFHIGQGVYCYTKMPFGFKDAGATYQLLVDKAFDSQIGQNIEVYIDDLVVKSHTEAEMLRDIGIKAYPDKTTAVLQLPSPRTMKEVQSLNGKLASLNRFLSKSAEKSLPLFKTLKKCIKKSDFHWTSEAEQAFKQLKQHFSELPMLVAPKPKEELIVYLSASYGAIRAVLMIERGATQMLVYFISRAL
nr:reverse transcriptase domain-containing protein [Tanacetum cinerariifolium]